MHRPRTGELDLPGTGQLPPVTAGLPFRAGEKTLRNAATQSGAS